MKNDETLSVLLFSVAAVVYLLLVKQRTGTDNLPINGGNVVTPNTPENLRRGERLNNPLNIEKSANQWQGLALNQPDTRFAAFTLPFYGIRAGTKILVTYRNKYGLDTIDKILGRYAPPAENDTFAYANTVSKLTGFPRNYSIPFTFENVVRLVKAMIQVEQGRNIYSDAVVESGVKSGLGIG